MAIRSILRLLAVSLALLPLAGSRAEPDEGSFEVAQLTIRRSIVVRVQTTIAEAGPIKWREKKGPKCLPTATILGAGVVEPNSVDFILRGGQRVRARFASSCPALAFYSGFYVAPNPDGQMCAGRDTVRDRAGGECEVSKLRLLVARP